MILGKFVWIVTICVKLHIKYLVKMYHVNRVGGIVVAETMINPVVFHARGQVGRKTPDIRPISASQEFSFYER